MPFPCLGQPRAMGQVRLSAKRRGAASVLDGLHQQGSMKALFPRPRGPALDAVLLNTGGGITGGDRFDVAATAGADTRLTITTQAAERAYKAQPEEIGRVRNRLVLGARATLDWLPQETILFDGAALDRRLSADLQGPDARLLLVEPVVFGRHAMGETLRRGRFTDRIDIRRDGQLLFSDRIALTGDIAAHLARPGIADGAGAMATVIIADPEAGRLLDRARETLPTTGGASLVRDGLLLARLLAPDGFTLRKHLLPLVAALSTIPLPRTWTL
ncbi:urease accessory protein ureD [Marinibacterium profundimaris]|uniref:Urease accessory protein UreD n=1 Tax=Marinibacterium profundimaris TaxID=1679460 RepID=A0A225NCG1_9RHOB|nr:urease accessory protein ureD [Marinibacterium profundimaris]